MPFYEESCESKQKLDALSQLFQMPIDVIVRGNRQAIVPGSMARMQRAKIIDFGCFS